VSLSRRLSRRKRVQRGAAIAVLTASTILSGSESVLAQASPTGQSSQAAAADTRRFSIQIAAGTLADALSRFTAQTGIRIVQGPINLAGLPTPGVTGSLTAADALRALLAGSGLTYYFVSANAVTLAKPPATTNGALALPPIQVEGQTLASAPDADPYADPAAP